MLTLVGACSDDDAPANPGASSSGTSDDDASASSDASPDGSSSGQPAACTKPATDLGPFPTASRSLALTTDAIITFDRSGGAATDNPGRPKRGALVKMAKAGGATSELYSPADNTHVVEEFLGRGGELFFLESSTAIDDPEGARLYRIPAAGGAAPVDVASTLFRGTVRLSAANEQFVFVAADTEVGHGIFRVPAAGGAPVLIADLASASDFGSVQIAGEEIWFADGLSSASIYKTPIAATAPSQVLVREAASQPCPLAFSVASDGIYCGNGIALTKYTRELTNPQTVYTLVDHPEDQGVGPIVYGVDGSNVYFGAASSFSNRASIRNVKAGETSSGVLACDIALATVRFDDSGIYVLDARAPAGVDDPSVSIKRIARP